MSASPRCTRMSHPHVLFVHSWLQHGLNLNPIVTLICHEVYDLHFAGDECQMRSPKQLAKLAMLLLLALMLLCDRVGNVHCSTFHENSANLHALLDFKQGITDDPQGALSSWSNNTHFCRWRGVHCTTTRPFRVSRLVLTGLDLAGQITSSLGNMTFLQSLDLFFLEGSITRP